MHIFAIWLCCALQYLVSFGEYSYLIWSMVRLLKGIIGCFSFHLIIWLCRSSDYGVKDIVNYRTISPKDLAKTVLSEGGWSNLVVIC